jgi:branched-chain amino acid transport system permease protein
VSETGKPAENTAPRMSPSGRAADAVATVVAVAALAVAALVWHDSYVTSLLVLIMLYALMAQSLSLTVRWFAVWNLGQLAIVAIGGYASGILITELGLSAWVALPAGVLAGGVAALLVVLPAIRVRGVYAAALTFAVGQAVRLLVTADRSGLTGGRLGLASIRGLFDGLSYSGSLRAYFWLTLVLSAAVMLLVGRMTVSASTGDPVGQTVPVSASAGALSERRTAIAIVLVSGLSAGLAGALYLTFYGGITPGFMGLGPLGLLVVMVVVGGSGSVRGPLLGAVVVTLLHEVLRDAPLWWLVAEGVLLVLVLAVWPAGIDGLFQRGIDKIGLR